MRFPPRWRRCARCWNWPRQMECGAGQRHRRRDAAGRWSRASGWCERWMDDAAQLICRLLFETHRDCTLNDLHYTLQLLERVPDMRLCADLSHYVIDREMRLPLRPACRLHAAHTGPLRLFSGPGVQCRADPGADRFSPAPGAGCSSSALVGRGMRAGAATQATPMPRWCFFANWGRRPYAITDRRTDGNCPTAGRRL